MCRELYTDREQDALAPRLGCRPLHNSPHDRERKPRHASSMGCLDESRRAGAPGEPIRPEAARGCVAAHTGAAHTGHFAHTWGHPAARPHGRA
jgi:hypothetical protein